MNRKLTLIMDERAIECGKRFAARNDASLSSVVETFLLLLDDGGVDALPISSELQSLMGIGAGPVNEEDYRRHLKYRTSVL